MKWLLFSVVVFAVIAMLSVIEKDWNTAVIALFAEFYFVNQVMN